MFLGGWFWGRFFGDFLLVTLEVLPRHFGVFLGNGCVFHLLS